MTLWALWLLLISIALFITGLLITKLLLKWGNDA